MNLIFRKTAEGQAQCETQLSAGEPIIIILSLEGDNMRVRVGYRRAPTPEEQAEARALCDAIAKAGGCGSRTTGWTGLRTVEQLQKRHGVN